MLLAMIKMAMTWMRMPMANDDNDDADCDDTGGVGECDDAVGEATDLEKTCSKDNLPLNGPRKPAAANC